jgi:hypothetical protein
MMYRTSPTDSESLRHGRYGPQQQLAAFDWTNAKAFAGKAIVFVNRCHRAAHSMCEFFGSNEVAPLG